jgi:hypothetical protein
MVLRKEDILHLREDKLHLREDILHLREDILHLREDILQTFRPLNRQCITRMSSSRLMDLFL